MLGRANIARFDFGILLGMGTCDHDTSHQFGERLLVHVEEHGANGWVDYVQSCGSHTGCCKTCAADLFCRSLLPRTLLTSERGLQTTLVSRVEGPFILNTSFIEL